MRILIAMMKHETNTFSPVVTDWPRFESWSAHEGGAVVAAYRQTRMPVAAYLARAEARGAEVMTPLAAEAMPSGPVVEACYERMAALILEAAEECDLALLDLHGAMVAEHLLDGEGELLGRLRARKPDLPIAVTCDLHCNLTGPNGRELHRLIGYKTYPHTDMYEVADQVAGITLAAADGAVRPTMAWGTFRCCPKPFARAPTTSP